MPRWLALLDGPQTLGRGPAFWFVFALIVVATGLLPAFVDAFAITNLTYFLVWVFMALGLSLIWGYAGILSFGQTAFFGLAGYTYGVISINLGDAGLWTWFALLLSLLLPAVLAIFVGYFMFYGGVRDVFVGIVTLSMTLVFETFMAQTAGPEWTIGSARLNGFNGMSNMPPLTFPWGENPIVFDGPSFFWLVLGARRARVSGVAYPGQLPFRQRAGRHSRKSGPGRDARLQRAAVSAFRVRDRQRAGRHERRALHVVGVLHHALFDGTDCAALPIIWVAAGGRKDITATLLATVFLTWLSQQLAVKGSQYALIWMGVILLVVVLFAPEGLFVTVWKKLRDRRRLQRVATARKTISLPSA